MYVGGVHGIIDCVLARIRSHACVALSSPPGAVDRKVLSVSVHTLEARVALNEIEYSGIQKTDCYIVLLRPFLARN